MLGQALQPGHFDATTDTISALAARGASDRWVMTAGLALLGGCHLVTAWGLRRPLLGVGGLATVLVAAAPQPAHGSSALHLSFAAAGFVALALWPVVRPTTPPHPRAAAAVLVALLVWFGVSLHAGALVGLSERVLAVAQALWPIVAVASACGRGRRSGRRAPSS